MRYKVGRSKLFDNQNPGQHMTTFHNRCAFTLLGPHTFHKLHVPDECVCSHNYMCSQKEGVQLNPLNVLCSHKFTTMIALKVYYWGEPERAPHKHESCNFLQIMTYGMTDDYL